MNREWILVACPTRARLFERVPATGSLRLVRGFVEDDAAGGADVATPAPRPARPISPQRRRHLRFATLLARQLEGTLGDESGDRVTLVAGCPFLVALRMSLSPALRRAVTSSVNIDMVDEPAAAIARELARHRFGGALLHPAPAAAHAAHAGPR